MEAIKGELTIAEIVSKYQVSKTVIHEWKKQVLVLANGEQLFEKNQSETAEKQVEQLHKIIGKLKVESDFLQDAWKKLKQ